MGIGNIFMVILSTLLSVIYGFLRVIITDFGRRLLRLLHLHGEEKRDIPIQSRDPPPAGFGNGDFIEKLNAARVLISEGIVEVRRCGVDENGNLKLWASSLDARLTKIGPSVPETYKNEVKEENKKNKSLGRKRGVREMRSRSKATVGDQHDIDVPEIYMNEVKEEKKKNKSLAQKRGVREMGSRSKATVVVQHDIEDAADSENNERKLLRKKKRKRDRMNTSEIGKVDEQHDYAEDASDKQNDEHTQGKKKDGKLRKRGRSTEKKKKAGIDHVNVLHDKVEDDSKEENGKSRKARSGKKGHLSSKKEEKLLEKREPAQNEIHEISSGDEDSSKGMKKWITEYHQNRPGLEILQQRIDDFMTAYEEQQEQARKEQEALAAEGGWTVVVHHKGRKKTTDAESGIAVGSVAQAAVLEKEAKKKSKTKDIGVDFYRFQKREAQRNEIMALQSKFEQDKKRIQQLRAARRFRPF